MGALNSIATPPLVSVVVRTMGRETLPGALASIAAQTHRPIEIVLVDAAGSGLAMKHYAGVPVLTVNRGRLDRPNASNAGLESARGAWITFLDEDDVIAPNHVAQLLATATVAGLPVVYSQTRVVDAKGGVRLLGGPYNRDMLLRSNFITMQATLFHRSLLAAGARFDETFATFEDWDFLLQLASRTDFAFTGTATADYRAAAGNSGAGGG